ncbi:MAG: PEP-CTERM sorting domain-containing protein [Armatimonadota bacterium]
MLSVVCTLADGVPPAFCDSLAFIGRTNGRYRYRAFSSDNGWDIGDSITLTGMEQITGASAPGSFVVSEVTPYTVTWTCISDRGGRPILNVFSIAGEGDIAYSIASGNPGSGTVTGPAYVPEPAAIALFSGGLIVLGGCVWRRRRSMRPHAASL